jgi:hypothetical protein
MPRTRRGIIRLWFVLAAIWSIGWLVFVAWREVVDHISPIATDFFLLPLIILAPWFITALVLVGRWVAVGFKSHNMDTGSDRHAILFIQHACQYYAAARFAMHAQCTPVCGILFHHTVEMLLKGGLAQKRTLSELEDMRHRLKLIWRAFKTDFPEPFLKRHDGTISSLAKFDAIRYWDAAVFRHGVGMTAQWERPIHQVVTYGTGKSPKQLMVVVSDIDDLVTDVLKAASWNPGTFMGTNPFALEAITRHNKHAEFLTTRF